MVDEDEGAVREPRSRRAGDVTPPSSVCSSRLQSAVFTSVGAGIAHRLLGMSLLRRRGACISVRVTRHEVVRARSEYATLALSTRASGCTVCCSCYRSLGPGKAEVTYLARQKRAPADISKRSPGPEER